MGANSYEEIVKQLRGEEEDTKEETKSKKTIEGF